jgi:ketosteroid isomerase-like protein
VSSIQGAKVRLNFLLLAVALMASVGLCTSGATTNSDEKADVAAIEKLHQGDITATLNNSADQLAALWAEDAVLLGEGEAPVSRRQTLREVYAKDPAKILKYSPRIESLEIRGNVAYEWGRFAATVKEGADSPTSELNGRFLRVMAKQSDGSWKFTRIMWQRDTH